MREQQAQEANDAQVADLKDSLRMAGEEAADLRAQLAAVVPRDQLTAAEQRIKVWWVSGIRTLDVRPFSLSTMQ